MNIDNKKQQEITKSRMCRLVFCVCLAVSVGLIIGGFFTPPTGEIDGSVLTAVGELLLFPTIAYGARAIELGYDFKIHKNDTNIEITND